MQGPVEIQGAQLAGVNEIYAGIRFEPSQQAQDRTFGLRDDAGAWIALGRIQRHADGALELGGYWVREDQRRRGLARRMVQHTLEQLEPGSRAWCIPLDHLVEFYSGLGLRTPSQEEVPDSIRGKIRVCSETFDACSPVGSYLRGSLLVYP